jgi:cysteine desulfurase / selenocysteine lyase
MPAVSPIRRYFDNAATSFPKPPGVASAMMRVLSEVGGPGRGQYAEALEAAGVIQQCRERVARLVGLPRMNGGALAANHVVFTHNTTDALNLAIKGVLGHARRSGGRRLHVVTTHMEHNSVLRPLNALMADDPRLSCTRVLAEPSSGLIDPDHIRAAIRPGETIMVIVNHASNVTGTLQDLASIGRVCAEFGACQAPDEQDPDGLLLVVDGAQSLGHAPIDMQSMNVDLLAFPGHKGLLGPTGTGGLAIRPGVELRLATIREGGTGSVSESETHPERLPEKFEAGSHNTVGIAGLSAGVDWLLDRGIERVRAHEVELGQRMLTRFESDSELCGLTLLGDAPMTNRVGVFSVIHDAIAPAELAGVLESSFGILTRAGLHCAPLVHAMLGTSPASASVTAGAGFGATRLSLGPFLTKDDVDAAMDALAAVCRDLARV